jgi:ABC-type bacteriocin/lantibiotic exporter with double-glycine peptidase domain
MPFQIEYLSRLVRFAFRANPLLYASVMLALLSVGIEIVAIAALQPLALLAAGKPLGDALVPRALGRLGVEATLSNLLFCFIALLFIRIVTQLASQGLSIHLGRQVLRQLGTAIFARLIRSTSLQEFQGKSVGHYISLAGDESARASALVIAITQFSSTAALAFLYMAAIFVLSPAAGVAVAAFLAICLVALLGAFRRSQRLGEQSIGVSRSAGSIFVDAIAGVRDLRAFNAEDFAISRYSERVAQNVALLFRIDFIAVLSRLVPVLILLALVFVLLLARGPGFAVDFAFAVTLTVMLMRFFPVVGQSLNLLLRVIADSKAGRDVTAFVDVVPASMRGAEKLVRVDDIELHNVGFSYGDKPVLAAVHLRFQRGRSYALRGPSGAGKSTLMDLVLGLQQCSAGRILVNGRSIDDVDVRELRRKVVLVGQQVVLLNDSIRNNLFLGETFTDAALEQACREAGVLDLIRGLPQGLDSRLSFQGSNLSGGQRQRIGIARALLRNPDVLILDESTNALDAATKSQVIASLLERFSDRILVFVTHDPYIVGNVTDVIDLERVPPVAEPSVTAT